MTNPLPEEVKQAAEEYSLCQTRDDMCEGRRGQSDNVRKASFIAGYLFCLEQRNEVEALDG